MIVDQSGQGVVPYLPLPELTKPPAATSRGDKAMNQNRVPLLVGLIAFIALLAYSSIFRRQGRPAGHRPAVSVRSSM